jgi:hypothetical protein
MTRDDYRNVLFDLEEKYGALGKAIDAMRRAFATGCFTDPRPETNPALERHREDDAQITPTEATL